MAARHGGVGLGYRYMYRWEVQSMGEASGSVSYATDGGDPFLSK